ncbi:MAG: tetratricopeptide repeat protein, partial [Thermodesulfovibrionales bacterium]
MNALKNILPLVVFFILCGCPLAGGADVRSHVDMGDAYYNEGRYDKAVKEYSEAISMDSSLAEAYYHRGLAYYRTEHYDEAIGDYTKAISLYPSPPDAQVYLSRGIAYLKKGLYDE